MEAAEGGVERLIRVISRDDPTKGVGEALDAEPYCKRFIEAMDDDFNTPQALAALFDLARAINQAADSGLSFLKAQSVLKELASNVLGLKLETFEFIREPVPEIEPLVNRLIEERLRLRNAKQWQLADKIRAKLGELGIALEDTRRGTVTIWKRIRKPTTPEIEPLVNLLAELGIVLEDTPKGTVRKRKR